MMTYIVQSKYYRKKGWNALGTCAAGKNPQQIAASPMRIFAIYGCFRLPHITLDFDISGAVNEEINLLDAELNSPPN